MSVNIIAKASAVVNGASECYIGVLDAEGYPSVSTVSSIRTDGIYSAFFTTGLNSNKVIRLKESNRASVCYHVGGDNVTLVGNVEILTDKNIKHELWQSWFIDHFPEGMDDPNYCAIKFTAKRVSLWVDGESAEFSIDDLLKIQSRCGLLCGSCSFRQSQGCTGCVETMGKPFHGECSIAVCCQSKGLEHCGQCPDMPCAKLSEYSCGDGEHCDRPKGARLEMLKKWR